MKIQIEVIPHDQQRYPTLGDYYLDKEGVLQVRISECGGYPYEMPILIHELVEWLLCKRRGIALSDIDAFDQTYEVERRMGKHEDEEPGDDPDAPYRLEHRFAENIERQVVHELGLSWDEYEARLAAGERGD